MNKQKGQTLIEAIVALVTILLIITAIAVVLTNGLFNSQFIKSQNEVNKYAQEGIEVVRNLQKNDLSAFQSYVDGGGTLCIDEQTSTLTTSNCLDTGVNTGGKYNRTITFIEDSSKCNIENPLAITPEVIVIVKWSSSKCSSSDTFCHKSELRTCMPYKYPESNP